MEVETVNDDVFDDEVGSVKSEGDSPTFVKTEEAKPTEPIKSEEDKTGEEDVETPSTESQETEETEEKLIPAHRFKAALKDATEGRDRAIAEAKELKAKLAEVTATPAPNREQDPEGYELHVRVETSKAVMAATHSDYEQMIEHYQAMAKENPFLNESVAKHPVPAQHAYNIAKEDLRVKELMSLQESDEWKEFQEFKKQKAQATQVKDEPKTQVKIPNINRATAVSNAKVSTETDDDLFVGAL